MTPRSSDSTSNAEDHASRRAWVFVIAWSLLVLLVANIPYLYGQLITPPGRVFMGDARAFIDTSTYMAWMHQAADGEVLFKDIYTTEPHQRTLFHPLFFALGRIGGWLHLPMVAVHTAARVAFGFGLLLFLYPFSGLFFTRTSSRLMAVVLASVSGGFNWLLMFDSVAKIPESWFLTGWVEANTFMSIYALPLFSASVLMMLGTFHLLLRSFERGRLALAAWAGVLAGLLVSTHFFDAMVVYPVPGLYVAVQYLVDRDAAGLRLRARACGVFLAVSAISPVCVIVSSMVNPVFREHSWKAALTLSPSLWWCLGAFGLLVPLALLGVGRVVVLPRHPCHPNRLFLVVWALAVPMLIYFPVPFQRRLVEGGHVAVAFLSSAGLVVLAERLGWRRRTVTAVFVALMIPQMANYLATDMRYLRQISTMRSVAGYLDTDMVAAIDWLERNTRRDQVVLADFEIGNYIPATSGNVVYIGHNLETLDFEEKRALVQHFFDDKTDDAWRQEFLSRNGIDLLFYSWKEKQLGGFDPSRAAFLKAVYQGPDVAVFRALQQAGSTMSR